MRLGRLVMVSGMTMGVALGLAMPASAAPTYNEHAAFAKDCKSGGGAVVEPDDIDQFQEDFDIDDDVDFGSCVGGSHDGEPVVDPLARDYQKNPRR